MTRARARIAASAVAMTSATVLLDATGGVLLHNAFIAKYRNLVTITANFTIDAAHPQPNPIGTSSDDGDMHVAGRSDDVGLPMVAELANGRLFAVSGVETAIHQDEGKKVQLTGVWRLWMEHKAATDVTQGDPVLPVSGKGKTNPRHVFEIHPITKFSGTVVLETFAPLRDDAAPGKHYQASDAKTAFARYEKQTLQVSRQDAAFTSIDGPQVPYNYTEFFVQIAGQPKAVEDGIFVLANIFDLQKHAIPTSEPRRLALVKDSRPAVLMGTAAAVGKQFHVLGIPRISLDELMRKIQPNQRGSVLGGYEMIILAVIE